ncbi:ABC-type bacteriocin/lantibiotic exporter, contains an N-terminal double-glycine peptidase domain [Streptomyces sp. DI166]|uniref:peptidase domain-containing ABC transporter n=1 Tax=unclassified Streptomyces TaxID=2593676 RepID=UPI0007F55FC4|nr:MULTISPECIES: ABC transporter transmembrane domain-containing protein [unclassified Streptomyces]SBT91164.1 ABC-type bacteriocin/lantibiotic exporter, contains an N-terminal double-glycine peptidase domain [Streptomyces sp. DI166]
MKWQRYHTQQSGDTDCGPACVRSVLLRHGMVADAAVLRESTGLGERGSNLLRLREVLRGYGVDSEPLRLDTEQLGQAVRLAGPTIILLDEDGDRHFVVVHEVTDSGHFIIGDPLTQRPMRLSPDVLAEVFHGEALVTDRPTARLPLGARLRASHAQSLVWQALRAHRGQLSLVLVATAVVALVALLNSLFVQLAVDHVMRDGSRRALAVMSAQFIGIALVAAGIQYLRGRAVVALSQSLQRQLSERYLRKLLRLPAGYFKSRRAGDLVSRIDDVQEIQSLVTAASVRAAIDLCVILSVGGYLLATGPTLFLFLIPPAAVNVLSSILLFPHIRNASQEALQRDATLKSETLNSLRGQTELTGYGKRDFAFSRMNRALDRRIASETRLGRLENINSVIKTASQTVFTVVAAWAALSRMLSGSLTVGQVFGFLTMAGYFLGAMDSVASLQVTVQRTSAALGRYRDVVLQRDDARLTLSAEEAESPLEPADITVRSLRFCHPGAGHDTLNGLDLDIPDGTSMLLRGANGSGKSTLLALLAGVHPDYGGSITLGSAEINRIPSAELPRHVLYVPEHPVLLTASLRENLTLGTRRSEADILHACRIACFLEVLDSLPEGLDEPIRETGTGLSRGQIQRLSIARAVLHGPRVYLFDETFSGIDRDTVARIWDALRTVKGTKVMVSHGHVRDLAFDLEHSLDSPTALHKGSPPPP